MRKTKKIIGLDGNEANATQRVGVNQYAYEILHALYRTFKEKSEDHEVLVFLKEKPASDLPKQTSYWKYKVLGNRKFWLITTLTPYLFKNPVDVFMSPNHYLPVNFKIPMICVVHDLGYLNYSGQFKKKDFWQLKYWTAMSISISKYIIAVSEFTKKDIVRHYPSASRKICVIQHGYDMGRFNTSISNSVVRRVRNKYKLPSDYILFIGNMKPSKNVESLIEAFDLLMREKKDIKLVIAGKKGWLYETIFEKVKSLKLENDIIFTGFVDEEDKPPLMKGARLLASPSYWEGFGMHVLEAMACGTPAVVSRVASLPEVAGSAGVYVDHESPKSIAKGLKKVIMASEKEYNKQIERSLKQVKKFGWQKAASGVLKVFKKI